MLTFTRYGRKRRELTTLCKGFLEVEEPLSTRLLAERAMKHRGLDTGDKVLTKEVCFRIVQALRMQLIRGKIRDAGRDKGARVWRLD